MRSGSCSATYLASPLGATFGIRSRSMLNRRSHSLRIARPPRNHPFSRRTVVRGVSKWKAGSGTFHPGPYVASSSFSGLAGAGRVRPARVQVPSGKIQSSWNGVPISPIR